MNDHPCTICGATPAPYGYRKPGLLRDQKKRGYVWACRDHIADVEAKWKAATNTITTS